MKKLIAIMAVTAILMSCSNSDSKSTAAEDSTKAAATADSLSAIKALADTSSKKLDTLNAKVDTAMKAMPKMKDSTKK